MEEVEVERMWQLSDFELGPRIGAGGFGEIHLARERVTSSVTVLKSLRKRRIERLRVRRHVAHEIEIQGHLRHPGVLKLYGFFWDETHIHLMLEHAPRGDLAAALRRRGAFDESSAARSTAEIAEAVAYCHRLHVIHRDLKPQNILIGRRGEHKLADFGWAAHTVPGERRWTLCGTLDYLPPEMVQVTVGHSFGVDVWCIGVLAYELLHGAPPFAAASYLETYQRILAATPTFPEEEEETSGRPSGPIGSQARASAGAEKSSATRGGRAGPPTAVARDFVVSLLRRDPGERPPAEDVAKHPWLTRHRVNQGGSHTSAECKAGRGGGAVLAARGGA